MKTEPRHIDPGGFGTVPFTLPLVPDCLYDIRAAFNISSSGNPSLDIILNFIVETLNYT